MKSYLLIIGLFFAFNSNANIAIFTDSHHPPDLIPPDAQVIYLDKPEQLLQQFFADLSEQPKQAQQQAVAMLQAPNWKSKEQQLHSAYQGVLHAWQLQLTKYPAIVFDNQYVVYGTTNIALAQEKLFEYKEKHNEH